MNLNGLGVDLRVALRSLMRQPGFTVIAILMLGLGLGATTAVFSLVNGVLLNPLPFREPDRLVAIGEVMPRVEHLYPVLPVNARHFVEWRKDCRSFEGMSAFESTTVNLTGAGEPERLDAAQVSPNAFRVLGVRTVVGRDFLDEEEEDGRQYVAILTEGLWRRRFQADPAVVGRAILLNGRPHTVVGVVPTGFRFPSRTSTEIGRIPASTDIFVPKAFSKEELAEVMGRFNYGVIARLRAGASREQAVADLQAVQARMEALSGEKMNLRADVRTLLETVVGKTRRGLLVLMGAIAVLLLIVCVNLANLLLARSEQRGREIAVRAALGAGRATLVRGALSESALLAIAGGIAGLAIAAAGVRLLTVWAPVDIPRLNELRLDTRVAAFAVALIGFTTLLFGLLPAWRVSRCDPQETLRAGGRSATASRSGTRLRSWLVACEVGLSALLLILSGLLMNSFVRLIRSDKGFNAPTVLAVDIGLSGDRYKEPAARDAFFKRVFATLDSVPGVQAAAISSALPLQGETWVDAASIVPKPSPSQEIPVNVRFVSADYFRTMGVPLKAGRTFGENDRNRKVSVISAGLAAFLWPGQDPVGRKFTRGNDQWFEVIGVAGDVRAEAHKPPVAMMYRPYWDWMPYRTVLVARAKGAPESIAGAIRAAVRASDDSVPVPRMRTMSAILDEGVAARKFQMVLAAGFGGMALLVACLGIYAVVSYTVARRTSEMGIRAALGARAADLYSLVLKQGLAPVAAGLASAVLLALAFGRVIESLLYEIGGRDPLTIAAVTAVLAFVALAACMVPARRAAGVDPLTALRYE